MAEVESEYEARRWGVPSSDPYAAYWNDEQAERGKEWWVDDDRDFATMERHVEQSGLSTQLTAVLRLARRLRGRGLVADGADLAAGTLWAVPHLLSDGAARVFAVEYSEHRLLKLGPRVLRHYGVEPGRAILCLGSFYELELPDASLDFVLMSQALHHADDPVALLNESRRVLTPDGVALVIGEHMLEQGARARLATVVGRFRRNGQPALPTNPETGDHYYRGVEYAQMFRETGLRARTLRFPALGAQAFVLRRR